MKFVFDIDNTILHTKLVNGRYFIRLANEPMIKKISDLYDAGHEIILHTARHWDKMKATIDQLENNGIKYHALSMSKPSGDVYIDDKAVRPDEFLDGRY